MEEAMSPRSSFFGSRKQSFAPSFDSSLVDSDRSIVEYPLPSPRRMQYLRRFSVVSSMSDQSSATDGDPGEMDEDPLINLDPTLREAVLQVEASKDGNDLKLFARYTNAVESC